MLISFPCLPPCFTLVDCVCSPSGKAGASAGPKSAAAAALERKMSPRSLLMNGLDRKFAGLRRAQIASPASVASADSDWCS